MFRFILIELELSKDIGRFIVTEVQLCKLISRFILNRFANT